MESWVLNPGILSRACFPDNQDQNPMQIPKFFSRSLSPVNPPKWHSPLSLPVYAMIFPLCLTSPTYCV